MSAFTLLARAALAVMFLAAGLLKLKQPKSAALALTDFRLIRTPVKSFGYLAGAVEVGAGLLLLVERLALVGAVVATGLLWLFVVLLARALRGGEKFPCFCFGDTDSSVSRWTIARTASLAVLASALLVTSAFTPDVQPSVLRQIEALIAGVALVGAALLGAKLPSLRKFNYVFMHPGEVQS